MIIPTRALNMAKVKALVLNTHPSGETIRLSPDLPKFLWKYMPPPLGGDATSFSKENLDDLVLRDVIRMTGVTEVNDPFDCCPDIIDDLTSQLVFERMVRIITKSIDDPYFETKRLAMRAQYPNRRALRKHKQKIVSENRPFMVSSARGYFEEFGFYSMSETPRNPAMWAHYASNSAGICIGFGTRGYNPAFATSLKVRYQPERPKLHLSLKQTDEIAHGNELLSAFLTKAPTWSYEKEWRFLGGADSPMHVTGEKIQLNTANIKFVLFGGKTTPENKNYVAELMIKKNMKHVKLLDMSMSPGKFRFLFHS